MRTERIIKRLPVAGLALILYVILSLVYFGTVRDYERKYLGYGDPMAYIWFLNWWPWAIAHGLNPFISHFVWYPQGFNLTWAGSMPAAALFMGPVTWLTNAAVSFNLLSLAAPALSAWTAFLLARDLTQDAPASFIGGYLFGFSSYELGHMLGHLSLTVTFVVPLLVLIVVQRLRGDLSRTRFLAILAGALMLQLGLATELLATACFFGALTWAIYLAFAEPKERRRLGAVAGEAVLATGIMAVVAAPFLYYVVKDRAEVPPQIRSPENFSADLLNYFIPTKVTFFGHHLFGDLPHRFTGPLAEQGAYLSLPLIVILLLQFRNALRRPYLKPLFVGLAMMLIFSLGPSLQVAGVATKVWLPWSLALHLPLIHQALPMRLPLYVALSAALVTALWLSTDRRGWNRAGRFTLALLACACLLPNRAILCHWTPLPLLPFFEPRNVVASLGQNANVLVLPYDTGLDVIWQWQSGMRFTQSGGYVGFMPQSQWALPIVKNLFFGAGGAHFENDISAFCVMRQVSAILVGPRTPDALAAAVEALRWPNSYDHGVRVVRVPESRSLHFHYVAGNFWPDGGTGGWMGREMNLVTHGKPLQLRLTGQYRPAGLEPVEIRATINQSETLSYRIGEQDAAVLRVPPDASLLLRASATFVPDQILHNGDLRALSVALGLHPDPN